MVRYHVMVAATILGFGVVPMRAQSTVRGQIQGAPPAWSARIAIGYDSSAEALALDARHLERVRLLAQSQLAKMAQVQRRSVECPMRVRKEASVSEQMPVDKTGLLHAMPMPVSRPECTNPLEATP